MYTQTRNLYSRALEVEMDNKNEASPNVSISEVLKHGVMRAPRN